MSTQDKNIYNDRLPASLQSDAGASYESARLDTAQEGNMETEEQSTFYLTGLRLDGRRDRPDFYTFLIEQNGEMLPLPRAGAGDLFYASQPGRNRAAGRGH